MTRFSWNKRDPHNQVPAVLLLLFLTEGARRVPALKRLRAYTIWNVTAVLFNYGFRLGHSSLESQVELTGLYISDKLPGPLVGSGKM